jgi:hypothetical protein
MNQSRRKRVLKKIGPGLENTNVSETSIYYGILPRLSRRKVWTKTTIWIHRQTTMIRSCERDSSLRTTVDMKEIQKRTRGFDG